jgi:GrpB-like predicted nucleotidyltransferase (UPF0157 family)
VAAPDPAWPARYDEVARQVREALGERVLDLQHVGSTSVAGLDAKPVIDLDLTVADSADEASYLPDLETAAFRDGLREHDDDRDAYAALKRDLATRPFDSVMDYNAEKGALVYEIYERIFAADPEHPHTPQPLG